MDGKESRTYDLDKVSKKTLFLLLFVILITISFCCVLFVLFPTLDIKAKILFIFLILFPNIFLLYLFFSRINKYEKVGFLDETKTIFFIKNGEVKNVIPCGCIANVVLSTDTVKITLLDGKIHYITFGNNDALDFYNQIKNEYVEKKNNGFGFKFKQALYLFATLIFILFCLAVLFNSMNCSCSKQKNTCTIKTYEFFSPADVSFKISDVQNVKIKTRRSGKHSYDEIHILLNENGAEYTLVPEISFYFPFFAEYFKTKLLDYKANKTDIFEYNYISPFVAVGIFIILYIIVFLFSKNKVLNKNYTLSIIAISLFIYFLIISNYKVDFNSNLALESKYCGMYDQASEFLYDENIDQALYFYKKAEEIYPDDYITALKIGEIYLEKKDYSKAIEYILKSINLNEENKKSIIAKQWQYGDTKYIYKTQALSRVAQIYKDMGDCDNAVLYQTKLLNEAKNQNEFLATIRKRAECYLKLNNKEAAFKDYVVYRNHIQEQIKENPNYYNAKNLSDVDLILLKINKNEAKKLIEEKPNNAESLYSGFQKIKINKPSEYDNLTKNEILELRNKYVSESIFASKWYKPNDDVFGGIEDKKPWYGIDNSNCPFVKDVAKGPSLRSIFINNPAILVGVVNHLGYKYPSDTPFCKNKVLHFIPDAIFYDENQKTIVIVYKVDNSVIKNIQEPKYIMPLSFVGINARDFGYDFVYAQNKYNIYFTKQNNVSKEVYRFLDYLHVGYSCKLPEGCNNVSPMQPELEFRIKDFPAGLTFKLWKNSPKYKSKKGDMNVKIIFEKI